MRMQWPNLTWRKDTGADQTYRARSGNRSFAVDCVGGSWRLRGWTDGAFSDYDTGPTAAAMQQRADDLVSAAS